MNGKCLAPSARSMNRRARTPGGRYQPYLDVLEDRTALSRVSFHIVQDQSPLALSGTLAGVDLQQQGPRSLTTTYFGDFQTDIDEAKGVIRFLGTGNDFCSADSGRWAPLEDGGAGTAPAAYGVQADLAGTALVAIRDFHWQADTGGAALALYPNNDGSFGFPSAQTLTIHQGGAAYAHPALGQGAVRLDGLNGSNQAADGNLVDNGDGTLLLTLPVSFRVSGTMGGIDYTLNFDGTMVGVGAFTAPGPGGHAPRYPAGGVALVAGARAPGAALRAAPGADSHPGTSENLRGVTLAGTPAEVPGVRRSDALARPVPRAMPAGAFDPLLTLDSLFQGRTAGAAE